MLNLFLIYILWHFVFPILAILLIVGTGAVLVVISIWRARVAARLKRQ